jgi:hypothetical protein
MVAVIGFFLVNCQFKGVQRAFIRRNSQIDSELRRTGILQFLNGNSSLQVVGTSRPEWPGGGLRSWRDRARTEIARIIAEGKFPNTFGLYLFILLCLAAEAVILF